MRKFNDIIESRVQLRSILKEPSELVTRKTLKYLDNQTLAIPDRPENHRADSKALSS